MPLFVFAKTVIKNFFGKPATLKYPFVVREFPKAYRGSLNIEVEKCTFCGLCSKRCPTEALIVNRQERTWEIERLRCITCSYCVEACPKKCLTLDNHYSASTTINKSSERYKASAPAAPAAAKTDV